jgi:hypothetical protein
MANNGGKAAIRKHRATERAIHLALEELKGSIKAF